MFWEIKDQTLYPKGHPYSWPIVGYVDDLERVTLDELKDFFQGGINNAYLVISGDVKSEEAITLSEKYFGPINRGEEVRKLRIPRVNLPQNKYKNLQIEFIFL